jgi:hypothetical protein
MANLVMDGVTLASKSGGVVTIQDTNVNFPAGHVLAVAYLFDVQAVDQNGSASTTSWSNRVINTENDPYGIVSLPGSNEFTLGAGYYTIQWTANTYGCGDAITKLYSTTAVGSGTKTDLEYGMAGYGDYSGNGGFGQSTGSYFATLASSTIFGIQQKSAYAINNGHGRRSALLVGVGSPANEKFITVTIWKLVGP